MCEAMSGVREMRWRQRAKPDPFAWSVAPASGAAAEVLIEIYELP